MFEKICIILLANLLFYAKTITYGYCSDDIPSSQRKETHPKWKKWLLVLEGHLKSFPQADHFITTVFHAITCVLIYTAFGCTDISFIAALLFSFNPITNQGSIWISGRGYVLSSIGMLSALTFPKLGLLFLTLATYSNAGFLAPLCLAGSPHPLLLIWMPFIWMFHVKRFRKNVADKIRQEMFEEDKKIHYTRLVIAIKTFAFYFVHALIPFKITFYHSYMQSMAGAGAAKAKTMKDRYFFIGLFLIGFIAWRFITQPWDMVNFGLLWWCICISPFINIVRMQQEIAERYCYLPAIGLMFVLASYIHTNPYLVGGFICLYAGHMWKWMDAYQDDFYLVEASSVSSPNSWFAWHVKAMKRWEMQSHQEAFIYWTMARNISPNEFKINLNLATVLKLSKKDKEAQIFFDHAFNHVPKGQEQQVSKIKEDWEKGCCAIVL